MKAILNKIKIRNFKGVEFFEGSFVDSINTIEAPNGKGKTTVARDSVFWCLYGESRDGQKIGFSYKPQDEQKNIILGLETEVETTWTVDGKQIVFSRLSVDQMSRKDSLGNQEYKGQSVHLAVDGFKCKTQKEFDEELDKWFDLSKHRMLCDPHYFFRLDYTKRREFLTGIAGEITDNVVLDTLLSKEEDEYAFIIEAFQNGRTIEMLKDRASETAKKLTKERDTIDPQIAQLKRQIAELETGETEPELKEKIESLNAELFAIDESEISSVKASEYEEKKIGEINDKIFQLNTKAHGIAETIKIDAQNELAGQNKNRSELVHKMQNNQIAIDEHKGDISAIESRIETGKKKITEINKELDEAEKETFNTSKCECPLKYQPCAELLKDFEENHAKKIADFEDTKQKKINELYKQGDIAYGLMTKLKDEAEMKRISLRDLQAKQALMIESLSKMPEEVSIAVNPESDHQYIECKKKIEELRTELAKIDEAKGQKAVNPRKAEINQEITEMTVKLSKFSDIKLKQEEITALQQKRTEIADQIGESEIQIDACDDFINTKMNMIQDSVNALFSTVSFVMFEPQKNGGFKNACTPYMDGVPYQECSTAQQVNIGLDFIKTISKHFDYYVPVAIDNRESVSEIPAMENQIINCIVDANAKGIMLNVK